MTGWPLTLLAIASFLAWMRMVFGMSGFWRADQRLGLATREPEDWPSVVAVIPARNEADVIAGTLATVLLQNYPGPFRVVVADDNSTDGTADAARSVPSETPLDIVTVPPLEKGWTGKVWALNHGIAHARASSPGHDFVWLTDADIEHAPETLRNLVIKAEDDGRDMVSLMAHLNCDGFWERLLAPAFIFFFQMLYPFPAINSGKKGASGAAGGCILIRRRMLEKIGGIAAIRGAVIDDCTLAAKVKEAGGRLWLGLTETSRSIREYGFRDFWQVVARSAYTELNHSVLLLLGTILGLLLAFIVPPVVFLLAPLHDNALAVLFGGSAWMIMMLLYAPTLGHYSRPVAEGLALPFVAALYSLMTVDSAVQHWRGRGNVRKERHYPGQ